MKLHLILILYLQALNCHYGNSKVIGSDDNRHLAANKPHRLKKRDKINHLSGVAIENKKLKRLKDEFNSTHFAQKLSRGMNGQLSAMCHYP